MSVGRLPRRIWLALCLCVTAGACGSDDSEGGTSRVCDPGETRSCVGPAACPGGQKCSTDGRSWGDCNCGSGGTGASGGLPSGGSGGTGLAAGTAGSGNAGGGPGGTGGSGGI